MRCPKLTTLGKQLAGVNRPLALAQANAVLSRIDLLCEVLRFSLNRLVRIFGRWFYCIFVIIDVNYS